MMAFAWNIRSIQHYFYCPHRWGLLEIDRAWAENVFVTKANLLHQRVHDPERSYAAKGKRVYTSVSVYYDAEEDSLFGVADLKALLAEMRAYLERGVIPPKKKGQKCSGCSLKDLCMPAVKKGKSIRSMTKELDEAREGF